MTIVTSHLERLGVRFEVLPHERAETAVEEARALGLPPDDVAKAVALLIASGPALAVILASQRLDLARVRTALGDETARLATEEDVRGMFPEFEPGALPAVPSLLHVPVVLDREVLSRTRVAFAAGIQRESIRMASDQLLRGGTVTIARIAQSPPVHIGDPDPEATTARPSPVAGQPEDARSLGREDGVTAGR